MTSYGPWIQEPDYTEVNETVRQVGDQWRTEYLDVDGPYGSVLPGTYTGLSLNRNSQPATAPFLVELILGDRKFALEWIQQEPDFLEPDGRSAILNIREAYKVSSASPYTDGAIFFTPETAPDGAVGIQYEGMAEPSFLRPIWAPSQVVGLTISGRMDATFFDSLHTEDESVLRPGSEFAVAVVAHQGSDWDSGDEPPAPSLFRNETLNDHGDWDPATTTGGPNGLATVATVVGPVAEDYEEFGGQSVEFEVDPGLLDPMGRTLLYTQMDFETAVPLGAAIAEQPDPPGIGGVLGYGYYLSGNMTATWTLRPPRYRWVYARGAAPPLRLWPRDDTLGNSPRLYPPPKTKQARNRISGYL